MDKKGVYCLCCSCDEKAEYVGETRVCFKTRMDQHKNDIDAFLKSPAMSVSGVTKHAATCQTGTVDFKNPKILATFQDKKKGFPEN